MYIRNATTKKIEKEHRGTQQERGGIEKQHGGAQQERGATQ